MLSTLRRNKFCHFRQITDSEDMTVKARMLKLLEQHENELISGEAAAAELNCTRAAIWKAVKSLREEDIP